MNIDGRSIIQSNKTKGILYMKKLILISALLTSGLMANGLVESDAVKLWDANKDKSTAEIEQAFDAFGKKYKRDGAEPVAACVKAYANVLEGDYAKAMTLAKSPKCSDVVCCNNVQGIMYANGFGVEKDISKSVGLYNDAFDANQDFYKRSFSDRMMVAHQFAMYKNGALLDPNVDIKYLTRAGKFEYSPINRVGLVVKAVSARSGFCDIDDRCNNASHTSYSEGNYAKILDGEFDEHKDAAVREYFSRIYSAQFMSDFQDTNNENLLEAIKLKAKDQYPSDIELGNLFFQAYKVKNKDKTISELRRILDEEVADVESVAFVTAHIGFNLLKTKDGADEALKLFTSASCNDASNERTLLCKAGVFTHTVNVKKDYNAAFAQLKEFKYIVSDYSEDDSVDGIFLDEKRLFDYDVNTQEYKISSTSGEQSTFNHFFSKQYSSKRFSSLVLDLIEFPVMKKARTMPHVDFLNAIYTSMNSTVKIVDENGKAIAIQERARLALMAASISAYVFDDDTAQELLLKNYSTYTGVGSRDVTKNKFSLRRE
jgi:hypothetical protein